MDSTWAQPSGVTIGRGPSGDELYVADSESSAIRAVDLAGLASSRNVVGANSNN